MVKFAKKLLGIPGIDQRTLYKYLPLILLVIAVLTVVASIFLVQVALVLFYFFVATMVLLAIKTDLLYGLTVGRNHSKNEVQKSELLRKHLFISSPIPTVLIETDGMTFVECNPAAALIFGTRSPGDVVGKSPLHFSPPEQYNGAPSSTRFQALLKRAVDMGWATCERKYLRADGSTWDGEVYITLFEHNGQVLLQCSIVDITSRKLFEHAIQEREVMFRSLFEYSVEAICIYKDGIIMNLNKSFYDMFCDHQRWMLTGRPILDVIAPGYHKHFMTHTTDTTSKINLFETKMRKLDGSVFDGEVGHSSFNLRGEMFTMILIRDISRRKKAEAELIASEIRFRQVARLSGHLVYDFYVDQNNITWEGAVEQVTGYTPVEFEGVGFAEWLDAIHPEDQAMASLFFNAFLRKEIVFDVEYRFKTKSGKYIWVEDECYIMEENQGKVKRVVGVMKSVDLRKTMERKLLTSIIETEEKQRLVFSQELHDGIGPLISTIKMYCQWLSMPNAKLNHSEICSDIEKLSDEATSTIREISFNLSPHVLKYHGLGEAIRIFVERVRLSTTIDFELDICEVPRFNEFAETAAYRVLCEAINNTVKYSRATRGVISILKDNNILTLRHTDNGIGFDPLKKGVGGIGLLNMESRLKSINSKLSLESNHGEGTKVMFKIDLAVNGVRAN